MDRPDGSPTAADVVLRPEWAAVEATDKVFWLDTGVLVPTGNAIGEYLVPVVKTLYIVAVSFATYPNLVADAEKNQMGSVRLYDADSAGSNVWLGGNGGGYAAMPKPLVYIGGNHFRYVFTNWAGHDLTGELTVWGYER